MILDQQSQQQVRNFASTQADWHRGVVDEVAKILRVHSVTQPNSRSTVELHRYALAEQMTSAQWARIAGGAR